ncbi:MAG TPA: hypothetical protein VFB79_03850 [Candidatus Angelobacter sp.]|nr:hypothetical protein [Candidatus Angelobacter sp.]
MNTQTQGWAIVRLVLGLLQMFGAVFAAVLIVQTGLNSVSIGAAIATGLLTLLSISLFGGMFSLMPGKHDASRGRKS